MKNIKVAKLLTEKKLTIATAESITGGLIANTLTNISGSSKYFISGIVAYSNKSKINILRIPERIIKKHGAVSNEVAKYMAKQVRELTNANIGLSTTGVAGPDKIENKPVGLVYIGLAIGNKTIVKKFFLKGTRLKIKNQTTQLAIELLEKVLNKYEIKQRNI